MSSSLWVFVAVKRKKEEWVFLFPFPEDKEYKENSEQAWPVLVFFFPLTDPNSECLWLSLHFCPLTLQELHFTPIFLWLCAKYIPYLVFTPTTPFPLELHVSQGRRATQQPDSITGLLTPVYDCLWNNARERNQDPISFGPHLWLLTASPCLIKAPRAPSHGGGDTVLEVWPHCVPLSTCWE